MIGKTISHYKILEKFGEGGMGVVYRAEDTKLDRFVALKFLPRHLSQSAEEKQRFIHEAKAASTLDHNNICTVYEIDETEDGQMFIAMASYEGESLNEKIESGPMAIEQAIDIATQISQGLAKAHSKQIIHRDIKPANLLISEDGVVKIVDFGLAKLAGRIMLTKEGTTLGTASYMSPEQTQGVDVDHRTDIWALGVVLYEMVTGKQPFQGDYEQAVLYSILNEDPEPITALRTGVPMELERIVSKALKKNPAERYQSLEEMLVDLKAVQKNEGSEVSKDQKTTTVPAGLKPAPTTGKMVGYLGLVTLAVVLATLVAFWALTGKKESIDSKSIAVLPFEDINDEEDSEYFSEGITEDIITQLSKISDLSVTSRSSIMRYKNTDKTLREIGTELNVATLLEGRIRRAGKRVRITAQLIDARTDKHLWAEAYDREMQDIFAIQSDVAQSIASALKAKLTPKEKDRIRKRPTENIEAYNLYLQGRYFWARRHQGGLQKALDFFQQAIAKDPDYALGYAGVADCYAILTVFGYIDPEVGIPKAKNAALKAIELDKTLAEPYTTLAFCNAMYDWDLTEAEKRYQYAIKLNPRYATARYWRASNLAAMGKFDESIAEAKRAVELEPLSLVANFLLAMTYTMARQYDTAFEQFRTTLEMDPNYLAAHFYLGWLYLAAAKYDEAIQTYKKTVTFSGGAPLFVGYLGTAYAMAGKLDKAQQKLGELRELSNSRYVSPYYSALIYYGLKDLDQAFEWLEKAYEGHEPYLSMFKIDPIWDGLRQDPRYDALVKKIGLD